MAGDSAAPHDPDAVLVSIAIEAARLVRSAAYLDRAGMGKEAAEARTKAAKLTHLLGLFRTEAAAASPATRIAAARPS